MLLSFVQKMTPMKSMPGDHDLINDFFFFLIHQNLGDVIMKWLISICYRYCGRLYLLCPYYFLLANSLIAQFSFYRKILEHGKHVLVDFPLCLTAEGGKKIFDLAESKGMYIKFSVYNCEIPEYSYRFNVCPWV